MNTHIKIIVAGLALTSSCLFAASPLVFQPPKGTKPPIWFTQKKFQKAPVIVTIGIDDTMDRFFTGKSDKTKWGNVSAYRYFSKHAHPNINSLKRGVINTQSQGILFKFSPPRLIDIAGNLPKDILHSRHIYHVAEDILYIPASKNATRKQILAAAKNYILFLEDAERRVRENEKKK